MISEAVVLVPENTAAGETNGKQVADVGSEDNANAEADCERVCRIKSRAIYDPERVRWNDIR